MDMSIRFPRLGLELSHVVRSVQIFGFEITIYGILIAVGMLLGIGFVVLEARRRSRDTDLYLDAMILSLIGGVIRARLYYVIFSWRLYSGDVMEILNIRSGGMAFYGALLGGVLAGAAFCRLKKQPFGKMADVIVLGLLLGQVVGRWGNFFNRESFGEYTDGLTAMQLPLTAVHASEVTTAMREHLVTLDGVSYIQAHPVFLYESLWCLVLLVILLFMRRKKRFDGELFMIYLAGYGLGRFFFQWLRTDKLYWPGTKIDVSQAVSAVLFVCFTVVVHVRRTMAKKRMEIQKRRKAALEEAEMKEQEPEDDWTVPVREEPEETGSVQESEEKTEKTEDTGERPDGADAFEELEIQETPDGPETPEEPEKTSEETEASEKGQEETDPDSGPGQEPEAEENLEEQEKTEES